MKNLFLVLALVLVAACGSKEVQEAKEGAEMTKSNAEETAQDAKSKAEETKGKAEGAADEAKTAAAGSADGTSVTCTSGKDERSITKAVNEQGGCEVVYTKNGESNSVANAKSDLSYCDNMVERIKGNLESAGFTCK